MRRSHVCLGCGVDLCAISAPLDPVYRLPVVRCPTCGTAAVRRVTRTPSKRTARSIMWFIMHMMFTGILVAASASFIAGMRFDAGGPFNDMLATIALVALVATLVATGIWLGAGLRHVELWKVLLGWGIVLVLLVAISAMDQPWRHWPRLAWREARGRAGLVIIMMIVTSLAALGARWRSISVNRSSMGRRLKRARKRRERMART